VLRETVIQVPAGTVPPATTAPAPGMAPAQGTGTMNAPMRQ